MPQGDEGVRLRRVRRTVPRHNTIRGKMVSTMKSFGIQSKRTALTRSFDDAGHGRERIDLLEYDNAGNRADISWRAIEAKHWRSFCGQLRRIVWIEIEAIKEI